MKCYFTDLHIHVGINEAGKWVKVPTSPTLTIRNIMNEAIYCKGLHIVGIVDALSPLVMGDLSQLIGEERLVLQPGGGYSYEGQATVLLGGEIETSEPGGGLSHTLIFLPDLATMKHFTAIMAKHIRNINISSQNAHMSLEQLIRIAVDYEPIIIPAHIFTPHKSLFGSCTSRISHIMSEDAVAAITALELGLSADTFMADRIDELKNFSFVTNSDAHSLDKIAREYNIIEAENESFEECRKALLRKEGRRIAANYGLNPRLGKYHRTCCGKCGVHLDHEAGIGRCTRCGGRITKGVFDRISEIADRLIPEHPAYRPPYFYQIPLEFIPGIGGKTLNKLLSRFGTEMNVLHLATWEELAEIVGDKLAAQIISARSGETAIIDGGGGIYGRLAKM